MAIKVGLRVTGIFFGSPLSKTDLIVVEVKEKPSVKDVLQAAVQKVNMGGVKGVKVFAYSPTNPTDNEFLLSTTVVYTEPPLKKPLPDGTEPAAGLYILQQVIGTPFDAALQWYHYRPTVVDNEKALIQLNIDSQFKPYAIPPKVDIKDGDEIVWRLVTIETAPISSPRALADALRNSGQSQDRLL